MSTKLSAGRELDALIAEKVMGWKVLAHHGPDAIKYLIDENQCEVWPPEFKSYSTDIAAAWEVVEKLRSYNPFWKEHNSLNFQINPCHPYGWMVNFGDSNTIEYGETAPHAICLAALKMVGYD